MTLETSDDGAPGGRASGQQLTRAPLDEGWLSGRQGDSNQLRTARSLDLLHLHPALGRDQLHIGLLDNELASKTIDWDQGGGGLHSLGARSDNHHVGGAGLLYKHGLTPSLLDILAHDDLGLTGGHLRLSRDLAHEHLRLTRLSMRGDGLDPGGDVGGGHQTLGDGGAGQADQALVGGHLAPGHRLRDRGGLGQQLRLFETRLVGGEGDCLCSDWL